MVHGGSWKIVGNPPEICLEKNTDPPPEQTLEAAAPTSSVRTNCGSNLGRLRWLDGAGWLEDQRFFQRKMGSSRRNFRCFNGQIIDFRQGVQLLGETSWKINEHHLCREDP